MKRVLLVGDERESPADFKSTLGTHKEEWELAFAPDGPTALRMLAATPFDVLVSDLRMPQMDGAALLKTVCDRFPHVVRILLSSQAEVEGALRAVPVAHQFLIKPCDMAMLRAAIERATSLSNLLKSDLLADMVGSVRDLPVLPRTYLKLRQALNISDVHFAEIVQIVEQDVGVSAKILQLVNSAFFGLPREISTLQTAVSFLGTQMLQNLVLSAEVFRIFEQANQFNDFSFEELQVHSQLTAKIAGGIPAPAHVRSAAVVAALLHDVGKLVLATRSPAHFSRVLKGAREEKIPMYIVEEGLTGVSHAEVGAYLLGLWGLPSPIVEAVAHHHHPERIPHDALEAVGIVHIANALAHEHPVYPPEADALPYQFISEDYVDSLGIADSIPEWQDLAAAAAAEIRASNAVMNSTKGS
jgi:HD-like signal output (HDOD) protein/CheY-like chemotaxis protein